MNKSKASKAASFALASAWFGTHCGSGFATGAQATSFWVKYGAHAFYLPIISVAIMSIVAYYYWEYSRTFKTYDYSSFSKSLYAPYHKVFGTIYNILFLGIMIMGVSAVFAGCGQLLNSTLGIPFFLGVAITMAITIILNMFGSGLLTKSASALSTILVVSLVIVTMTGIIKNGARLGEIATNWETSGSAASAIWSAILYASFQCAILGATINLSETITSKKESKLAAVFGLIMNGLMMVVLTYMLLSAYPGTTSEALPVLAIAESLGIPFLVPLYSLMLFLSFITTAITCIGSIVKRVENMGAKQIPNPNTRRGLYSFALVVVSFCIAQFGLLAIIKQGYTAIGYLSVPFIIIPILAIAPRKIKKAKAEAKANSSISSDKGNL